MMSRGRQRVAAAVALGLLAAVSVAGDAPAPSPEPRDERASWIVGFSVLETSGLTEEQGYLAFSIPLLLRDQLEPFTEHVISAEERRGLAEAAIGRERARLLARIADLRARRDRAGFAAAPSAAPSVASAATDPQSQLAEALEELSALDGLDVAAVQVPASKPIALKAGQGAALLLETPVVSEAAACAAADLDLLVGGSVRLVQGYLLLDLWAWDAPGARRIYSYRDAASQDELYDRVADAGRSLAGLMAGKPWAALEVVPEPAGALVQIDQEAEETGRMSWHDLDPGVHQLAVRAPGYITETRSLDLAAATETSLVVPLRKEDLGTITVTTDPPGADGYFGAVWQGRTPFTLDRPALPGRLLLRRPGSYDLPVAIGPQSPQDLQISLEVDRGPRSDLQRQARDRFYTSFGLAALSAPVPFLCYGWAVDWAAEATRLVANGSIGGAQRAVTIGTGLYWGYLGGMALTATLTTWTIINLVRYVTAANRPAD